MVSKGGDASPSLKGVDIYESEKNASENLRMRIHYITFMVGPITIREMGSRGDRVGGLIVKELFKVTALRFS